MKQLSEEVLSFFQQQNFVIVSTLDEKGKIHCSAKGLADLTSDGKAYIFDLYRTNTFKNLKRNLGVVSITAIDEQRFMGFTLKGKAEFVEGNAIAKDLVKKWESKVVHRISNRLIRNIQKEVSSPSHPESKFPQPQYLAIIEVEEIIDLAPRHLKRPVQ